MNKEFIDKMKEAKKIEGEALRMILPENVRGHVEVIQQEMKVMLRECMTECAMSMNGQEKESEAARRKVNKVEID